ncbi:hypothetical protein B7463_g10400, partial [Scytalidium lignicola]
MAFSPEYGQQACVYCGLPNPSKEHFEEHNYSSCAERSEVERTFYRKDHLRQHLNLVHDVKFQGWSMDAWKVATPEIRSRCGFCGLIMDTWGFRVDHVAEHFKSGKSMADWKGDWGFDQAVHELVENGMPPYLIHDERNTMKPYVGEVSADQRRTPYDLVKIALLDVLDDHLNRGEVPTDEDLLTAASKTITKLDAVSDNLSQIGWFRDLILTPGSPPRRAQRKAFVGKDSPMEDMAAYSPNLIIPGSLETDLIDFVKKRLALGLTPTDKELQVECCCLIVEAEKSSIFKCRPAVHWFQYLINDSSEWLAEFRKRASLPRSDELICEHKRSMDDKSIDFTVHNHRRLERELIDFVMSQKALGHIPSDSDIQRQARMIIYGNDDPWNQTMADNPDYIEIFKRQYGLAPQLSKPSSSNLDNDHREGCVLSQGPSGSPSLHWDLTSPCTQGSQDHEQPLYATAQNQPSANSNPTLPLQNFLNDSNCYRRLVRELSRFVQSCLSPNNPNQHIPTDGELQNQARWVIYDDDDPWNQTAADNAEWLIRFKRDVGLLPSASGPGLPDQEQTWHIAAGGSGFSPPYTFPNQPPAPYNAEVRVTMQNKPYIIKSDTANSMLQSLTMRYEPPGKIFCSRELETGLNEFVGKQKANGVVPSDDELRTEARKILGIEKTAADDQQLLEKFKGLHGIPGIHYTSPVDPTGSSVSPGKSQGESGMMSDVTFEQIGGKIPDVDDIANLDFGFDLNFPEGSTF